MKIKFHNTVYNLVNGYNQTATHFQASFFKENHTFNNIVNDTLNVTEITVLDDEDNVTGVFTGYSKRIALYVYENNDEISVEFENTDINAIINNLSATVATQEAAIADLGDETSVLYEDNATQDLAIEDLAEAVDALTPEGE